MSHEITDEPRPEYIHEALGITEERAAQIFGVVDEQLDLDTNIASRLQFLRNRSGWTPEEDAFALFMFGYGIREIELMHETLEMVDSLIGALDFDGK